MSRIKIKKKETNQEKDWKTTIKTISTIFDTSEDMVGEPFGLPKDVAYDT
jgi:hypothetical protein